MDPIRFPSGGSCQSEQIRERYGNTEEIREINTDVVPLTTRFVFYVLHGAMPSSPCSLLKRFSLLTFNVLPKQKRTDKIKPLRMPANAFLRGLPVVEPTRSCKETPVSQRRIETISLMV